MSEIIVICNWDGDSAMYHPISKERLPNNGESYILSVSDKVQFIDDLINNRFELSDRVHSALINMIEEEKEFNDRINDPERFTNLVTSHYAFGNFSIQIIEQHLINQL